MGKEGRDQGRRKGAPIMIREVGKKGANHKPEEGR